MAPQENAGRFAASIVQLHPDVEMTLNFHYIVLLLCFPNIYKSINNVAVVTKHLQFFSIFTPL